MATNRRGAGRWRRYAWAAALAGAAAFAAPGCAHHEEHAAKTPAHSPHNTDDILPNDPSATARLRPLATHPATTPATQPEPAIVEQGDRSTLIYTARQTRTEVLAAAIEGLISPEGSIQP